MVTAIRRVCAAVNTYTRSIASNHTTRPNFDYTYNPENGEISVKMHGSNQLQPKKVSLIYAQNLSKLRRDFRWIFQSNERTEPCTLPFIPIPNDLSKKRPDLNLDAAHDLCLAPIIWKAQELNETAPGEYKSLPPEPAEGYWMGYYLEVEFPGDTPGGDKVFENHFVFTTPGWTWPNTLPFPDCKGEDCKPLWV